MNIKEKLQIETIKDYVSLQTALFDAFLDKYPSVKVSRTGYLSVTEKDGHIILDNKEWLFHKHGDGVHFTCMYNGVLVDNDRKFDKPNLFCARRLCEYLKSLYKSDLEIDFVEEFIFNLLSAGKIEKVPENLYKLA